MLNEIELRGEERIKVISDILAKLKPTKYQYLSIFFELIIDNIRYVISGKSEATEDTQNELIKCFIEGNKNE